ncbi:hypothetical protein SLEP1_g14146 [Rubroshorea leprosula]|uniref:Uncharacterized protein n=1 Tax=Rubroshorea leprosula TaxID=152421 RepID=A0AAV5IMK5_9ROSI|nr:hypothetical protein SLEP1_g14146 [Rubroshorea leprosula]
MEEMVVAGGESPAEEADDGSFDTIVKGTEMVTADEDKRMWLLTQIVMNSFLLRFKKDRIPVAQKHATGFLDHASRKKRSEKKRTETKKTDAIPDSDTKFPVFGLKTEGQNHNLNEFKIFPSVPVIGKLFERKNDAEKELDKIQINFKNLIKPTGKRVCEDRDGEGELGELEDSKKHKTTCQANSTPQPHS